MLGKMCWKYSFNGNIFEVTTPFEQQKRLTGNHWLWRHGMRGTRHYCVSYSHNNNIWQKFGGELMLHSLLSRQGFKRKWVGQQKQHVSRVKCRFLKGYKTCSSSPLHACKYHLHSNLSCQKQERKWLWDNNSNGQNWKHVQLCKIIL